MLAPRTLLSGKAFEPTSYFQRLFDITTDCNKCVCVIPDCLLCFHCVEIYFIHSFSSYKQHKLSFVLFISSIYTTIVWCYWFIQFIMLVRYVQISNKNVYTNMHMQRQKVIQCESVERYRHPNTYSHSENSCHLSDKWRPYQCEKYLTCLKICRAYKWLYC